MTALGALSSALTVVVVVVFSLLAFPVTPASDLPLPDSFKHSNATSVGHSFVNLETFPSAFSAITLSFGGHACFPSLEVSAYTLAFRFLRASAAWCVLLGAGCWVVVGGQWWNQLESKVRGRQ